MRSIAWSTWFLGASSPAAAETSASTSSSREEESRSAGTAGRK